MNQPPMAPPRDTYVYPGNGNGNSINGHGAGTTTPYTIALSSSLPPSRRRWARPRIGRWIGNFFVSLTSADRNQVGSNPERHYYITIGALMLVTAAQAFYAATFFAAIGFGKPFRHEIGFGIFFAASVYLIDRSIIGYAARFKMDKNGQLTSPRKASPVLGIRILIAIAAAMLMSEAVLLQFFSKDISAKLQSDHVAAQKQTDRQIEKNYQQQINPLQRQINGARKLVASDVQQVKQDTTAQNCQEFGCSGIPAGIGPGFKAAHHNLVIASRKLTKDQTTFQRVSQTNNAQIKTLHKEEHTAIVKANPAIFGATAGLSREEAFWQLTTQYGTVLAVRILLTVLILGIDLAPILTKLTGRTTVHDNRAQNADYVAMEQGKRRMRADVERYSDRCNLDRDRHHLEIQTTLLEAQKQAEVTRAKLAANADVQLFEIDRDTRARKYLAHHDYLARMRRSTRQNPGDASPPPGQAGPVPPGPKPPPEGERPTVHLPAGPGNTLRVELPAPGQPAGDGDRDADPKDIDDVSFELDFGDFLAAPIGDIDDDLDIGALLGTQAQTRPAGHLVLNNRWELHSRLVDADAGSGGIVWQAKDLRGGSNWLVVKTAPAGSVSMDTVTALQSLGMRNDQRAQGMLSPYIGEIIESGEDPKTRLAYIVSPLYQPGSLALYCNRDGAQRTLGWCTRIVIEILKGLLDASQHGIVHLDIKPANVVLDGTQARIIDWGLSRAWNGDQPYTAVARGTVFFASPEQFTRPPGWDTPLADVFGVGATFYWLLTHEPPLSFDAGYQYDMLTYRDLIAGGVRPQKVHELVPKVPRALSDLIDRWISYQPVDRLPQGTPAVAATRAALSELEALSWQLPDVVVGKVTGRRRRRRS